MSCQPFGLLVQRFTRTRRRARCAQLAHNGAFRLAETGCSSSRLVPTRHEWVVKKMPATTAFSKHRTGQFPDRIERQGTVFAVVLWQDPRPARPARPARVERSRKRSVRSLAALLAVPGVMLVPRSTTCVKSADKKYEYHGYLPVQSPQTKEFCKHFRLFVECRP